MFKPLKTPALIETALKLPSSGLLSVTETQWTYLDIDNDYIHRLYPLLENDKHKIYKPEYCGENLIGAHITVIYPEENKFVHNEDLGKRHQFTVKGAFSTDIDLKRYYILRVEANSLIDLRSKYGLGNKLCFKNHLIHLHITIGSEPLKNSPTIGALPLSK